MVEEHECVVCVVHEDVGVDVMDNKMVGVDCEGCAQ